MSEQSKRVMQWIEMGCNPKTVHRMNIELVKHYMPDMDVETRKRAEQTIENLRGQIC